MRFVADPMTLAVALGLLGPAALGRSPEESERRSFDEESQTEGSRSCQDLCDEDLDLSDDDDTQDLLED